MQLKEIQGNYSVLRYPPDEPVPDWLDQSRFFCVARTDEELSIVCDTNVVQGKAGDKEDCWKCLKVQGPLDFTLTGVLSSITSPLAKAEISIFAISTFDTDYILIKEENLEKTKIILREAGFDVD
jgi:uncharacterized protein